MNLLNINAKDLNILGNSNEKGKIKTIPAPKRGGGKKKAPVKSNTTLKNNKNNSK